MADAPKKLRKVVVDRVDLVDRGSNPDADIVLFKREKDAPPPSEPVAKMDFNELLDLQAFQRVISQVCSLTYTLENALSSSAYSDLSREDRTKEIQRSVKQFSQKVDDLLGAFGKRDLEKSAAQAIRKVADEFIANLKIEEEPVKIDKSKLTPEEVAHLEDLEKRAAQAPEPKKPEPAVPEDVMKSLPESVRQLIEKSQTDAAQAKADAAAAQEIAKKAQADAQFEQIKKRVEIEYPTLPGTVDEKAAAIQKAEATGDKALIAMLRAGEEAMKKALTATGADKTPDGTGAYAQLMSKAADIKKADPKLSDAQAFNKAVHQNPELYKKYRNGE